MGCWVCGWSLSCRRGLVNVVMTGVVLKLVRGGLCLAGVLRRRPLGPRRLSSSCFVFAIDGREPLQVRLMSVEETQSAWQEPRVLFDTSRSLVVQHHGSLRGRGKAPYFEAAVI